MFYDITIGLRYTLDKVFCGFLEGDRAKPCQRDHFRRAVDHFARAQVWPAWLLFPYGNER